MFITIEQKLWQKGRLYEHNFTGQVFGCICGCHIGSAMGAPVEGMTYEEIDRKYGYVDGYLRTSITEMAGTGTRNDRGRRGTTEADDFRDYGKRGKSHSGGCQGCLEQIRKSECRRLGIRTVWRGSSENGQTGIPATDLGRYCDYAGLNSFARACHPIGLINAGNVEGAKEDILQVGQLYQTTNSVGWNGHVLLA